MPLDSNANVTHINTPCVTGEKFSRFLQLSHQPEKLRIMAVPAFETRSQKPDAFSQGYPANRGNQAKSRVPNPKCHSPGLML